MKQINVGLLGFGISGRVFHAPIFTSVEGFHLSKIFTRSEQKKEQAGLLYPEADVVDNVESIIDDPNIDLIVIALPNTSHYEMAERSLIAGKHVVVEKPFTNTTEEATALIHTSKEEEKLLSVFHNRRYDGDFLTLKTIIDNNTLGDIKEFESHFDRFRTATNSKLWRESMLPGSGILFDLGSHLIDQAVQLFGMPNEVYADIRTQRPNSLVDDNFEIILYYTDLKVTLKSGMLVKEPLPRFILLGDKGSYVKYGVDPQEAELKQNFRPDEWEDWGLEDPANYGTINYIENDINIRGSVETLAGNYTIYYQNIYDAIVNGKSLEVTADQARDVIHLIELAKESNVEKRRISLTE
ncbi:MAG: oxidoreductase [Firmicutes bacterium HGW-Firmicutes-1]|jgi:predicted dehydrogenase|nr:MAG: oxidoreductase [Firmicutes bacterium HGW-Firmicutes-1]